MLRDKRKDAGYFKEYIGYQNARIEKFENVLQKIIAEGGNATKELQCNVYLTNFYQDLLLAEYSCGNDVPSLKRTYMRYLAHAHAQKSLTYDIALCVFAWAILLEVKNVSMLEDIQYPQDGLLEAFSQYLKGNWPVNGLEEMSALLPVSEELLKYLTGKRTPADLKKYIENNWYESSSDAAWYGSDTRGDDTYCGYWCLAGAAVIKMMQWNPCLFADTTYCPVELLF